MKPIGLRAASTVIDADISNFAKTEQGSRGNPWDAVAEEDRPARVC
jgi:hypothetical protein